jgi:hypothetical protein
MSHCDITKTNCAHSTILFNHHHPIVTCCATMNDDPMAIKGRKGVRGEQEGEEKGRNEGNMHPW